MYSPHLDPNMNKPTVRKHWNDHRNLNNDWILDYIEELLIFYM